MTDLQDKYNQISIDLELTLTIASNVGKVHLYKLNNLYRYRTGLTKKLLEKLVKDYIVQSIFGGNVQLIRNSSGVPALQGTDKYVSISHSGAYFAFYVSDISGIGVDVEQQRTINPVGYDYFLNTEEQQHQWSQSEVLSIWCAKETYYKMKQGNVKDLNAALTVLDVGDTLINALEPEGEITFGQVSNELFTLTYTHP